MKDGGDDLARLDVLGRAQARQARRVGDLDRERKGGSGIERGVALGATADTSGIGSIVFVALAGAAVGAGLGSLFGWPVGLAGLAGAVVALLGGAAAFLATLGRREAAARSKRLAAEDERNAERARQIEAARASGQFDRFERD